MAETITPAIDPAVQTPQPNGSNAAPDNTSRPVQPMNTVGTVPPATPSIQTGQPAQTPPAGAPAAPAQPGTPAAEQQHHGALGEIFQTLAGGKKKVWEQTDNGPVARYEDLKPGEMARGILAAAITGLAAGYDPANRGKGAPPMSAAFSAGFKGEQEAKDKQAGQAQEEAQQQFKNAGVAQERQLALHRDAREQQASIQSATQHALMVKEADQRIAKNEIDENHNMFEWNQKQEMHIQNLKDLGATIMEVGGQPLTFRTHEDAEKWLMSSEANHQIALRPGKFDSVYEQDPTSGTWSIWQKPADRNRPQWLGVKVNDQGEPVLKDGKMQVDAAHPFYDMNGKAVIPAERMTPQEFYDRNEKTVDMRSKRQLQAATAMELRDKGEEYRDKKEKDNAVKVAREHLNKINGNYNATDQNGNLILTDTDREVLRDLNRNTASYFGIIRDKAMAEQANMTRDNPKYDENQQLIDYATQGLKQEMYNHAMLQSNVDNVDALAANVIKSVHPNNELGDIKPEQIDAQFKDTKIPKALQDKVKEKIEKLNKANAVSTDKTVEKTLSFLQNVPADQRVQQIQSSVDKKQLTDKQAAEVYKRLNIEPPVFKPAPAGAETIKSVGGAIKQAVTNPSSIPSVNVPGVPSL